MVRLLILILSLMISITSWSQTEEYQCFDSTGLLIEKEFYKNDKLNIRVVYIYNDRFLVKRIWYNSKGGIVAIILDYREIDDE
jgi:hypothetical protein